MFGSPKSMQGIARAQSFDIYLSFSNLSFDAVSPCCSRNTVFIRISAQLRTSAHLEQAPILKAEKVNRRPASNKRPPPPHPTSLPNSNKHPLPSRYHPQKGISTNKRLPRRQSFLQTVCQKPCFVTSSHFGNHLLFFFQNIHTTLVENGENLIRAQPQISAHLE